MKSIIKKLLVSAMVVTTLFACSVGASAYTKDFSYDDYATRTLGSQYMGTGHYKGYIGTGGLSTTSGTAQVQMKMYGNGYTILDKNFYQNSYATKDHDINAAQTVTVTAKKNSAGTVSGVLKWSFNYNGTV